MTDKTGISTKTAAYNMLDAGLEIATVEKALKELNTPATHYMQQGAYWVAMK